MWHRLDSTEPPAPRENGTWVLLYKASYSPYGPYWDVHPGRWSPWADGDKGGWLINDNRLFKPTHWMPMPSTPPPKDEG